MKTGKVTVTRWFFTANDGVAVRDCIRECIAVAKDRSTPTSCCKFIIQDFNGADIEVFSTSNEEDLYQRWLKETDGDGTVKEKPNLKVGDRICTSTSGEYGVVKEVSKSNKAGSKWIYRVVLDNGLDTYFYEECLISCSVLAGGACFPSPCNHTESNSLPASSDTKEPPPIPQADEAPILTLTSEQRWDLFKTLMQEMCTSTEYNRENMKHCVDDVAAMVEYASLVFKP